MKKFISVILCLCIMLTVAAAGAENAYAEATDATEKRKNRSCEERDGRFLSFTAPFKFL